MAATAGGWRGDFSEMCRYGTGDGRPVVLLGDSLAAHWFPPMRHAADAAGRPLISFTDGACPALNLPVYRPGMRGPWTECAERRATLFRRLIALDPAVVVLSNAFPYQPLPGTRTLAPAEAQLPDEAEPRYLAALGRTVADLTERLPETALVVFGPAPTGERSATCVADALDDRTHCAIPLEEALDGDFAAWHRRVALDSGAATWIDVSALQCAPATCPAVVGDRLVSYDGAHLTTAYTRLLGPVMAELLQDALTSRQ